MDPKTFREFAELSLSNIRKRGKVRGKILTSEGFWSMLFRF